MLRTGWGIALGLAFAALGLVCGSGCGGGGQPTDPGPPATESWALGAESAYPVDALSEATVADTVTGFQFQLPEGGHGMLRVAPILSGPVAPLAGRGLCVSFDGEVPLRLVVDDDSSDAVLVMGYGALPGAYDDIPGPGRRWYAVPQVDSLPAGRVFQLNLPFTASAASRHSACSAATTSGGSSHYWISSIPAGSNDATRRMHLQLEAGTTIDQYLTLLSPARRTLAAAEVGGRMRPHYEWDGLYYTGFWWRSLGSLGRIVRPTIHLKLTADASNVAHEAGHYFTHVLVGDDTWSALEGQAPLWDTGHGPRDVVGREVLLEDYAYWSEWLLMGSVKSYDLHDPYVIFGGLSPLTVDFPSLEGFGAVMLASLTRTTPEMRHLINGRMTDVPVLGFTNAQVYDLIALGATGIESLREHIATAASSQADKLPAILQRSGWRHSVRGRLVQQGGGPLVGATVASVSIVGDRVYRGGSSSIPTSTDGRFAITGEVFPGDSKIRVWDGRDSLDVDITIPWTQHTDVTHELGDLVVSNPVGLAPLKYCTIDLFTHVTLSTPSGVQDYYQRQEIDWIPGSFSGGTFTGSQDSTIDHIPTSVRVTASVDPATGKVQSLDITRTRLGDTWTETTHFVFVNVPMISCYGTLPYVTMQCGVEGEATCSSITQYTDTTEAESGSWVVTGYGCAPDHESGYISSLDIFFQSSK